MDVIASRLVERLSISENELAATGQGPYQGCNTNPCMINALQTLRRQLIAVSAQQHTIFFRDMMPFARVLSEFFTKIHLSSEEAKFQLQQCFRAIIGEESFMAWLKKPMLEKQRSLVKMSRLKPDHLQAIFAKIRKIPTRDRSRLSANWMIFIAKLSQYFQEIFIEYEKIEEQFVRVTVLYQEPRALPYLESEIMQLYSDVLAKEWGLRAFFTRCQVVQDNSIYAMLAKLEQAMESNNLLKVKYYVTRSYQLRSDILLQWFGDITAKALAALFSPKSHEFLERRLLAIYKHDREAIAYLQSIIRRMDHPVAPCNQIVGILSRPIERNYLKNSIKSLPLTREERDTLIPREPFPLARVAMVDRDD